MSSYLRKMVVQGPAGVTSPGSDQDYRQLSNASFYGDTGTGWIRLWAPWWLLQLDQSKAPNDPAQPGAAKWDALSAQVDAAAAAGLRVILTAYGYAYWSNGTSQYFDASGQVINAKGERENGFADRYPSSEWSAYTQHGSTDSAAAQYLKTRSKTSYLKFPADRSAGGPWAAWIDFLIATFSGRIWGLEICNEPSTQNWPLQAASSTSDPFANGTLTVQNTVADMFKTAHDKNAARGFPVRLLGPGPWTP